MKSYYQLLTSLETEDEYMVILVSIKLESHYDSNKCLKYQSQTIKRVWQWSKLNLPDYKKQQITLTPISTRVLTLH